MPQGSGDAVLGWGSPPTVSWPDGTQVWLITLDEVPESALAQGRPWLDEHEAARAARFEHEPDRRLFEIAHVAARSIAAEALGCAPVEVVWRRAACPGCGGTHGRPIVAGGGVEFSLAHARGLVAVALAEQPVGVDVEPVRAGVAKDVASSLHPDERREIEACDDHEVAFTRAWTRSEAYLKALGIGLGRDTSLDYLGAGPAPERTVDGFVVRDLPTPSGFSGAVATWSPET